MNEHVFVRISYDILNVTGLFEALSNYIGFFKIEQTMIEAHDKVMNLWFWTDKIKLEDGKSRQVSIDCKKEDEKFVFEMKYYPDMRS